MEPRQEHCVERRSYDFHRAIGKVWRFALISIQSMYTKFSDALFFTTFVVAGLIATTIFVYSIIAILNPSALAQLNQTNQIAGLAWRQTFSIISMSILTAVASAVILVWRLTRETKDGKGLQAHNLQTELL